jgi:4-diphosphocytidyl-2-C-methyl-D-erythritol kinase
MTTLWHQINAPAKFNLCLQVLKKREDGYHELLSFAGFTRFGDRLSVCVQPQDKIIYEGPFADALIRAGGDSLCKKLCQRLREAGYDLPPLHIRLEKNIPLGGGLGGGSTDAAALLRLISEKILPQTLSLNEMMECAAQIGADVPVCLYPGWQIMTGTGIKSQAVSLPIALDSPVYVVLANPGLPLSTAEIFAGLSEYSVSAESQLADYIQQGNLEKIIAIGNDLTAPAVARYPEIARLIEVLGQPHKGFIGAGMSGSGSSCFALTTDKSSAQSLAQSLKKKGIWAHTTEILVPGK